MKYFNRIYSILQKTDIPLWKYCLIVYVVTLIPSIIYLNVVSFIIDYYELTPILPPLLPNNWKTFINGGVIGPILETLFLVIILKFINELNINNTKKNGIAAIIFGLLHGVISPIWFGNTFWYFFIFSNAYTVWLSKSFKHAFLTATLPHMMINLSGFAYLSFF